MTESPHRYRGPDTSDKTGDETWTVYWDRKRRERHGPDCLCALCAHEGETEGDASNLLRYLIGDAE